MKRIFLTLSLVALFVAGGRAFADDGTAVVSSTTPIGSPYFRHLAYDLNVDLRELVKFERHGFGREEMVSIILMSKASGTPLKEYGKRRRQKDPLSLRELATEAGLDYPTLYKLSEIIKQSIEAQGDTHLPDPVFETPKPSPTPKPRAKKRGKASPAPSPAPNATPAATPTGAPTSATDDDFDDSNRPAESDKAGDKTKTGGPVSGGDSNGPSLPPPARPLKGSATK